MWSWYNSPFVFILAFVMGAQYLQCDTLQDLSSETIQKPFTPFTGRISKNRVRMRLTPSLESPIVKELERGDLLLVTNIEEEFYVVKPPQTVKGYIFRTFVLDNVVEGNRVNVRLLPDKEAPVMVQLNQGDRIEGEISPLNSKWLEITPPGSVHFYVIKEYVENIGGPSTLARLQNQKEEIQELLDRSQKDAGAELQKPFAQINLGRVNEDLRRIINDYPDFPDQATIAQERLSAIQTAYMQKKIVYLESKTSGMSKDELQKLDSASSNSPSTESPADSENWIPVEQSLYQIWANDHEESTIEEFYADQKRKAIILSGFVEPYIRHIINKPGDYLLLSRNSRMPIAYLYSTKTNLKNLVGKHVNLIAVPRPNNNFAYPAYFVFSAEESH